MCAYAFITDVMTTIIIKRLRDSKESEVSSNHMTRESFMEEVFYLYVFLKIRSESCRLRWRRWGFS